MPVLITNLCSTYAAIVRSIRPGRIPDRRETPAQMIAYLLREAGMLFVVFGVLDSLPPLAGIPATDGIIVGLVGLFFVAVGMLIERERRLE